MAKKNITSARANMEAAIADLNRIEYAAYEAYDKYLMLSEENKFDPEGTKVPLKEAQEDIENLSQHRWAWAYDVYDALVYLDDEEDLEASYNFWMQAEEPYEKNRKAAQRRAATRTKAHSRQKKELACIGAVECADTTHYNKWVNHARKGMKKLDCKPSRIKKNTKEELLQYYTEEEAQIEYEKLLDIYEFYIWELDEAEYSFLEAISTTPSAYSLYEYSEYAAECGDYRLSEKIDEIIKRLSPQSKMIGKYVRAYYDLKDKVDETVKELDALKEVLAL